MNRISGSLNALLCALLLSSCVAVSDFASSRPNLPQNETLWFQVEELAENSVVQTSVLAVQGMENGNSRWILSDPFGVPQARMIASEHGWQKDGFAPPNRTAKQLFVQMFPLLQNPFRQPELIEIKGKKWRVSPIVQ
ncbi:MAG: hypothetical protein IKZ88_03260 [Neisseriaceae bacterium]|nr:hypothetical protein [Neisseriaceae bacterium]